jgi:hypothetical protein
VSFCMASPNPRAPGSRDDHAFELSAR